MSADMLALLERCVGLERAAAGIYDALARRFAHDAELAALWTGMAAGEREHARKLAAWRVLLAAEPAERRPRPSGFAADVTALERLLAESRTAAETVDEDGAFALALAMEGSELDAIYTTLLQASPLARFPDLEETVHAETAAHHEALLRLARRRCRDDRTRLRIALLAARAR